ncbi:MAG: hypothetical protein ACRD2T_01280 [Thermoanaerobaculia bacterium]
MSTVQELSALHRRYADLSHRFRSAWTFHQFLQSLAKSGVHGAAGDLAADFQTLYGELKEISEKLSAAESERVRTRLDAIEARLGTLVATLDAEDNRLPPSALRQFFQRVRQYDEKILTQLVKFYLYARPDEWPPDRLDKIDFLLTRLCGEEDERNNRFVLRDRRHLGEIFRGLWALIGAGASPFEEVRQRRDAIEALRQEALGIEDLDQLNDKRLVRRYRDLKHSLGVLYFEPDVLVAVQETNLVLKSRVQRLYRQEERRIVDEYQRVFDLEREVPVDMQLDQELTQFRQDIERFEQELRRDEMSLEHLAQIRQWVRSLVPRLTDALTAGRSASGGGSQPALTATGEIQVDSGELLVARPTSYPELLAEPFQRLVSLLLEQDPELRPEAVVLRPGVFTLRIEPREVVAHRRLHSKELCDRELELFLCEAAALRILLNEEAQEIAGILDETSATGEAPIFDRARLAASAADDFMWRFHHLLATALTAGAVDDGRELQLLQMRLMRDYAGLWLLAYKPLMAHGPGAPPV